MQQASTSRRLELPLAPQISTVSVFTSTFPGLETAFSDISLLFGWGVFSFLGCGIFSFLDWETFSFLGWGVLSFLGCGDFSFLGGGADWGEVHDAEERIEKKD